MKAYHFLNDDLVPALTELAKDYSFAIDSTGQPIRYQFQAEARIEVVEEGEGYVIYADSKPHFFLGFSQLLLRQQKGQPVCHRLTPSFEKNGLMLDNSRNGVASVAMVKSLLRRMAFMGHSWYMLYMEDVYQVEGETYFGLLRGRYTSTEMKEMDDYADLLGIELIPCIQTLAHINQFFRWEAEAKKYQDIDDILNVGRPATLALIERMIVSLRQNFRTNKIHLGMDEACNLGRGYYFEEQGLKPKKEIMLEHLINVMTLCQKYQFEPIIWDDMFFSDYANLEGDDTFRIPEGIELMYWDYYNTSTEHYSQRIQQRRRIAGQVAFAGGAWRWTGYTPHHQKTLDTTLAALTACKREKVTRVIATSWSDDGCESPFYNSLFGLVLFAFLDNKEYYEQEAFDEWLNFYTNMGLVDWLRQGKLDLLDGFDEQKALDVTPSKYLLYQDPLMSHFLYYIEQITDDYQRQLTDLEEAFFGQTSGWPLLNQFYGQYAKCLSLKWDLPLVIRSAYLEGDKERLMSLIVDKIEPLQVELKKMLVLRRQIWLAEAKPMGLEILEHRFGAMLMRLEITASRLTDYIEGRIESIPELDEERPDPVPDGNKAESQAVHYNRALRIMSVNRHSW